METMSALDSAFLQLEDSHSALQIGSISVFEGSTPDYGEVRAALARKLPLVPRYRQRMRVVPGNLERPVWVDDPDFDLDYHLGRMALPSPGGDRELQDLAGLVMSQPLDHDRPLWETWMVEGLDGGRWALITKVHHSVVDGIAGTDLLTKVLDPTREPEDAQPDEFDPPPMPQGLRLVAMAARQRLGHIDAASAVKALNLPRKLARRIVPTATGLLRFATAVRPVSASSLQGSLSGQRRFRWAEVPIDELQQVRKIYGGTLNDVVLTGVSCAFQGLLISRGEDVGKHTVRTLVPVSVRRPDQHGRSDNRVSGLLLDLPVDIGDPVIALEVVSRRMTKLKKSHEADAGELVTELADLVPPPGLAAGLRLAFRVPQRVLTTVTTNVPGPRTDLYLVGRRMLATYPYVPIADRIRIGIAVTSYSGRFFFGITGDWATTPDLDVLRDELVEAFAELTRRAAQAGTASEEDR